MTRFVAWSLGLILASAGWPALAGEVAWVKDIKEATERSTASGKPLFVDVWAVWCAPCLEMDRTTYRDDDVVGKMEEFVPLKVERDVQEVFCDRHRVEALPAVLYLDHEGREIARREGLASRDELLPEMSAIAAGYSDYLQAMARAPAPDAARAAARYLLDVGNPERAAEILDRAVDKAPSAAERETTELMFATAREAANRHGEAIRILERLAERSEQAPVRREALERLVPLLRAKGKSEQANRVLERLAAEFPQARQ